jgi:hypothetical protein
MFRISDISIDPLMQVDRMDRGDVQAIVNSMNREIHAVMKLED